MYIYITIDKISLNNNDKKMGIKMDKARKNRFIAGVLFLLLIASSFIFGVIVLSVGMVALATSLIIEVLNSHFRKETFDWTTFMISPLIITLMTTPVITDNIWMVVVATAFGVFFAKAIFGGEGKYIFNPATVGLVFIAISFPVQVNEFLNPLTGIISTETPATMFKTSPESALASIKILELLKGQYVVLFILILNGYLARSL